jgi:hypothetical protein
MIRGIEGRDIFFDDSDREDFLSRVRELSLDTGTRILAWALMNNHLNYALKLLIPAAFPSILTGLKIGWAFAWRTLIAAELVFGVSAGQGGLGWAGSITRTKTSSRSPVSSPASFASSSSASRLRT